MRILHVEDDESIRKGVVRLLNASNLSDFRQFADLESAIAAIDEYCPDVIITDAQYPLNPNEATYPNAWEALVSRLLSTGASTPVIINTASDISRGLNIIGTTPFEITLVEKPDHDGAMLRKLQEIQRDVLLDQLLRYGQFLGKVEEELGECEAATASITLQWDAGNIHVNIEASHNVTEERVRAVLNELYLAYLGTSQTEHLEPFKEMLADLGVEASLAPDRFNSGKRSL